MRGWLLVGLVVSGCVSSPAVGATKHVSGGVTQFSISCEDDFSLCHQKAHEECDGSYTVLDKQRSRGLYELEVRCD